MARKEINIVWLKRDIRSQDHQPLQLAEQSSLPYLIIYIFEPSVIAYPDTSNRHLQFQYHSLLKLNQKLQPFHRSVLLFYAEALAVFSHILQQYKISHIFSYQESGTAFTFERDKAVGQYCKGNGITWKQCQRDGIVRGLKNRQGWDQQWYATMEAPIVVNKYSPGQPLPMPNPFPLPKDLLDQLYHYPKKFQPPGEDNALSYLESFVRERGKNYSRHISKPLESRTSCGRISPYISWGNISVKQAYQLVRAHSKIVAYKKPFHDFLTRLKWHCHFIQKFEMECSYEYQCINAGYELLQHPVNEAFIRAWKTAQTGFPLIDACMKCLQETGWLNFRMRAMLVSFLCHHLNQDWRTGTYHLANLFLDYEPGIHYPQFQMQAGTTGINTIRIYNPVKQSKEHDPDGLFIKKWLPQLEPVPASFIHEPHKMTLIEQQMFHVYIGKDYPAPLVDITTSARVARTGIWGHRNNELVKEENRRILFTHTRRKDEKENLS
ncbi:MAG: deoxyribodipyrimidine photo-lyase [Bacteroidota bacterium]|nr:deoxyribodipyrimidine photo-lyase [Bacteroidota bacterium]